MSAVSPEWLQDKLQSLLNSPYIHFNRPQGSHLNFGHGPVDLFSTRFNNWFTSDATGVVAGKQVDKQGLKDALLALQKKWNNDSAQFSPVAGAQDDLVATRFEFTPSGAQQSTDVTASASVQQEGGTERISTLTLDGDESLFT